MATRDLQLTLLVTIAAAVVVMLGLLPTPLRLACLAIVLVGVFITAPERNLRGGGWWLLLAIGGALSLLGFAVGELAYESAGGFAAIAGAALVIVGSTIGFPLSD
jgi:hypothetical protein